MTTEVLTQTIQRIPEHGGEPEEVKQVACPSCGMWHDVEDDQIELACTNRYCDFNETIDLTDKEFPYIT